ncbi:hypothetical protein TcYC6_0036520 [Trypanosoma cruzi]|nr:hypothetical protein TcYC6_0036520 [Trypanosoma cruzi]
MDVVPSRHGVIDTPGDADTVLQKLADGGYHRARVKALPVFDRIAGGLTWGILSSRHRLHVEFVENATIREKICISEKICNALKRMQCPIDLRPHQIHGLDYSSLLPVAAWLLKRVEATRAENAFFLEKQTAWDFSRRFGTSLQSLLSEKEMTAQSGGDDVSLLPPTQESLCFSRRRPAPLRQRVSEVADRHSVEKPQGGQNFSRLVHVSSALLEYGIRYEMRDSVLMLRHVSRGVVAEDEEVAREVREQEEEEMREERMFEMIIKKMRDHRERMDGKMSLSKVKTLMQTTKISESLQKLSAEYHARQQERQMQQDSVQAMQRKLQQKQEATVRYRQESEALRLQCEEAVQQLAEAQSRLQDAKAKVARRTAKWTEYMHNLQDVYQHVMADPVRGKLLQKLQGLLDQKEEQRLLLEETRRDGKQRLKAAKANCVALAERSANAEPGVDDIWEKERAKYVAELRRKEAELSAINQKASDLLRRTDAFPTRLELMQIHMRICELNEEVSSKYEELRAAFARHNTRMEILKCLESEDVIMTQLAGKMEWCLRQPSWVSKNVSVELVREQERVVTQLRDSLDAVLRRNEDVTSKMNAARKEYESLLVKKQQHRDMLGLLKQTIEEQNARMEPQP